ncbi:MAG: TonB-dependent receptor [Bacteroidia bacterium]|nr:TonB-dependent receptor [Bacteroidia bacterium]
MRITILFISLLFLSFPFLSAQTGLYLSDTVTVEASRLGLKSDQMGKFVSLIDRQQIENLPVRSVDELLRFLPGVEIQARGAFGTQADISMRGGTFNQVLVLMDGMRINDPLTGHFQTYLPVTLEEIERIEILRGPGSAQYGPDAVGGVINIITRTFSITPKSTQNVRVGGNAGQYGLLGAETGLWNAGKKVRVGAGGRWISSDGQPLPSGNLADFKIRTATASLGIDLGKGWDLAMRTGRDTRTFQAQYFYTTSTFDESREETGRWWNQARLSHKSAKGDTRLDISYLSSTDSFLFNPAFAANIHQTGFLNANLHHLQQVNSRLSWAAGAQASRRAIESNDRGDHADTHMGAYAMLYAQPVNDLHLSGSLRVDQDVNYGTEVTPQLNASYQLGQLTLRSSVGRSIRAADYTERFVSTGLAGPLSPLRNLGNPDLVAETAWSYEAGLDMNIVKGLSLSLTGFQRQGRNLIDYVLTNFENIPRQGNLTQGADYLYASNLSSLNTTGLELFIQENTSLGSAYTLHVDAGYTFLNADSPDGTLSKYLSNIARHQVTGRAALLHKRFSLGLQTLWRQRDAASATAIGATLEPTFMIWHLQGQVFFFDQKVALQGQVFNMFNEQYSDLLGAQMPGRWWVTGLSLQLGR